MWAVLQTVLVIAFLSYWLYRAETMYREFTRQSNVVVPADELVASDPLPDDLIAYANGFQQDWARQQTVDGLHEMYAKMKDWQQVRQAIGLSAGTI
jgi:hypothetical protein